LGDFGAIKMAIKMIEGMIKLVLTGERDHGNWLKRYFL
jgi:hypothetical protein